MKKGRFDNMNKNYDDYEDEDYKKPKREEPRRRPVRNWKKAWDAHSTDYEDADDFYTH